MSSTTSFTIKQAGMAPAAVMVTVLLAACGGGDSSSPAASSPPPPPSSGGSTLNGNGGLWAGTVSAPGASYDGNSIIGVYTKSGESKFWIYNGTHGGPGFMVAPGSLLAASDTEFTGSYLGLGNDLMLPNGTDAETGTVDVTVNTADGSLSGNFVSDDSGPAQDNASFTSLAYDQTTYNSGSSQSALVANGGNYGFQFNLPGTGTISGTFTFAKSGTDAKTDTITGVDTHACTYSGSAVVINSKYDAYDVTLTRRCIGSTLALSGVGVFYPGGVIAPSDTFGMLLDDGGSVGVEIVAQ